MIIVVFIVFSLLTESAGAYTIESLLPEKHVLVGQSAVISCKYSGNGPSFQWYRQYPRSRPEYLIFNAETAVSSEPTLRLKAMAKKEITEVELEISSTEVKDSAVYYCALVPTVTGNPPALGFVYSLQWYRQYVGSRTEFLILVNENSEASEPSLRLSAKDSKEKKQVNLTISSAEVTDSALYYCALRPTVTESPEALVELQA
ncbi:uncharacterized protein [Sinocyclocheilus grahami]|uniref:uncharacterized protein n=1 Tax=Sinocyclocheilus grahami TaxID=75366 RepID=UPI0007AD1783|nr:PREDICTED: uncharacterized protein LOC107558532 [Sinocyclocheilus grahami]